MDTSTADFSTHDDERNSARGQPSNIIENFAKKVYRPFKIQFESERHAGDRMNELPDSAVIVKRVLEQGAKVDGPPVHATSDSALVHTIGASWSIGKLREELAGQAVHQRVGRGTLLALPTNDGATIYPIFQFIWRNGELKVKPGLLKMFKILHDQDPWRVAVLLNTPAPELGGLSPVAWEKEHGGAEELETLAEAFVREWGGS